MPPIKPEDRARYDRDWKPISRAAKVRAGWRCECTGECGRGHQDRCNVLHGARTIRGTAIVLDTAHLDHQPEDCRPENLRVMCRACHLAYDRDQHLGNARRTRAAKSNQPEGETT